jgi:hypothetical protein
MNQTNSKQEEMYPFLCDLCDSRFSGVEVLVEHLVMDHDEPLAKTQLGNVEVPHNTGTELVGESENKANLFFALLTLAVAISEWVF